jgi:hypothetical protein
VWRFMGGVVCVVVFASRVERTVLTPFFLFFSRHDRRHGRTYVSLFPLARVLLTGVVGRGRRVGGAMIACPARVSIVFFL